MVKNYLEENLISKRLKIVYRDGGVIRVFSATLEAQDKTFLHFRHDSGSIISINRYAIVKLVEGVLNE